jgi:hypothetical protein
MRAASLFAVVLLAFVASGDLLTAQQGRNAEAKPVAQTTASKAKSNATAEAAFQVDFKNRIDHYLEMRREAKKGAPAFKETKEPAQIKAAESALAARIQTLRSTAQPGDIFTAEIQKTFRRLLAPELKGEEGQDTKEILKDDAPKSVPLKVNAKYPEGAPLPTVPSNLLLSLPALPEQLDYRIVGKHLILRDTEADIIVDFIPNAIK